MTPALLLLLVGRRLDMAPSLLGAFKKLGIKVSKLYRKRYEVVRFVSMFDGVDSENATLPRRPAIESLCSLCDYTKRSRYMSFKICQMDNVT